MQWDSSRNYGFSDADTDSLYLPQDTSEDAPTVEAQLKDSDSLLNEVKALTALRHKYPDLQADGSFEVVYAADERFPFVFRRGKLLIAVNPSAEKASAGITVTGEIVHQIGEVSLNGEELIMKPQSFAVVESE